MAAFTEGFSNVSGAGSGKLGQHLGKTISMVLEARQLASDERKHAQNELSKQDPGITLEDIGVDRGYFFKKALQHEFGGAFVDRKKESLKKLLSARKILKSKKRIYVTARNFLRDNTRFASVNTQRAASFRKKFNYKVEGVESPAGLEDSSKKVAKAASGGGKPKTKQDFLTAVTEIAKSLQSTAQSINNAVDQNTGIASGIVSSQKNIVFEISHRTDTVSDKLEAIAAAVNQQTEFLKRAKEDAKSSEVQKNIKKQKDGADTFRFDDSTTKKKDESLETSTSEEMDQNRPPDPWGTAEKGAIIDGPKEGYNVNIGGVPIEAHGKELVKPIGRGRTAIVPLDNYATDGIQGNEVTPGGDLKAEKGLTLASMPTVPSLTGNQLVKGLSGLNLSKTIGPGIKYTPPSSPSSGSQDMISAMELPFRAVGASILKVTGDLRNRLGAVSPAADAKLDNIMNVITNAFGLSSQDVAPTKSSSEANSRVRQSEIKKEESKDDVKWYDRIKNFIGNITKKTGEFINDTGNKVKDVIGGMWKWGKNQWNRFFGKKQTNFSQKEIAAILVDEFKNQGLSEDGARLAAAEFMRETSLDQGLVLGSHDDGGVEAFGAGSWQGGREDALFAHLESLGIGINDIANSGEKGIRGNASFLVEEIASRGNAELMELLKKPNLNKEEQDRVRKLFKDAYFVYAESIPLTRSEESLKYIMEMLGVELDTSSFKSSTSDLLSSNNLLEELNLGNLEETPEISHINLGSDSSAVSNAYTTSLNTADKTLNKGSEWDLKIKDFYPQKLHV